MEKAMVFTEWEKMRGYGSRKTADHPTSSAFAVVEYDFEIPESSGLPGKRLLFFSDLHWGNSEINLKSLSKLADEVHPDWIVFGGDLTNYACFFDEAFAALAPVFANLTDSAKIAVPGNWDRRRRRWFPNSLWTAKFAEIGFHHLINESRLINGIHFHGIDDLRTGHPVPRPEKLSPDHFNCLLSHNPANIARFAKLAEKIHRKESDRELVCLALSGHTHGGQIRIPRFGALLTSTKYWKLFEYGRYRHKPTGLEMIVSSGLGTTRLPIRLFCDPEVVILNFKKSPAL
ncbi:MAG: metallophosphoesterase [Victivallales bacterium]|nr:metallophosphoesterase [Victivallales bacterium]